MPKKIKVAMFADTFRRELDGATRTLYKLIDHIPDDQLEYFFLASLTPENGSHLWPKISKVRSFTFPFNKPYPICIPFFDWKIKKKINTIDPDVIHIMAPSTLGIYAILYGKKRNIPRLVIYHTHFVSYIKYYIRSAFLAPFAKKFVEWYYKWFYNNCDKILVPTEDIIEELLDLGIKPEKMVLWARGIDTSIFNHEKKNKELIDMKYGAGKKVLFVSRIVWEKDLETLIKIYENLKEINSEIKVIIAGDGQAREDLEKSMPDAVFTGTLPHLDLAVLYASCDVFIFPSITETFGNVIIEAQACGLPSVIADKGGTKSHVKNGWNGYHAKAHDADDFTEKILEILNDEELQNTMSQNAIEFSQQFSWDNLVPKYFNYIRELADRK